MQRLDFVLPDFTRVNWVSDRARSVWEARLSRVGAAWSTIEWMSVVAGVRPCGLTSASPAEFVSSAGRWARRGLCALPIEIQGVSPHSYSSTSVSLEYGKPFAFRLVLGTPATVAQFQTAWEAKDQTEIGRLLGYPPCCYQFFREAWVEQGLIDTTWPMALRTASGSFNGATTIEVEGPPESNILWRWMGVRAVPHLPCSFHCSSTVELARKLMQVGKDEGHEAAMRDLVEILSWPVQWSSLHGIAEIKTPILRVSTRTDAAAGKLTVRRRGERYPEEAARGLAFPYIAPSQPLVTLSPAFQRGMANPVHAPYSDESWYAVDNGFDSVFAMDRAHRPIADRAAWVLRQGGAVLDLGCGNGRLLRRICDENRDTIPFGVDCDPVRVEHARLLHADCSANFVPANLLDEAIWSDQRHYRLALLMPGRLLEAGAGQAEKLRRRIHRHCDHLLIYAYADWLTAHGGLERIAKQAGLRLLDTEAGATAGFAAMNDG